MSTKHPPSSNADEQRPSAVEEQASSAAEDIPVSYGFIITATALICVSVWVLVNVINQAHSPSHPSHGVQLASVQKSLSRESKRSVWVSSSTPSVSSWNPVSPLGATRNLKQYYKNRAFPGAPPRVPHPVAERKGQVENCLSCHGKGGFVPKYNAYAPVTPHPTFTNCSQCHVPQRSATLFRETHWVRPKPPKLRRTPLPGGPPAIPHSLHLRTNCNACHAGPSAVRAIRTPHPERTNCLQCHVPRQRVSAFVSKYGLWDKATLPSTRPAARPRSGAIKKPSR
ncbi:MAG: hypothetical protein EP343_17905 [Deltaproteobacteria bacterium]|nr:MAG: hypothetical protein EP343_17905 [Deltaproteobacteria bacterium]